MICNLKSLIYIFKKVKNKKIYEKPVSRMIIQIAHMESPYRKVSLKKIFKGNHYDKIFECYDILIGYFYDRQNQNKNPSYKAQEALDEWWAFVCEKIVESIEYEEFFHEMYGDESREKSDKRFNLFKLIFW